MEFFKRRSNDFFRGLGAEFAFRTQEGLCIVSGGKILKIRMVSTPEGLQRIVLIEDEYNVHVLFEGAAVDAAARFVEMSDKIVKRQSTVSVGRKGLYAVLAGFTAVYLIFCHPTSSRVPVAQPEAANALQSLLTQIPSIAGGQPSFGLPNGVPSMLPAKPISGLPSAETPSALTGSEPRGTASPVLDKPDFLSLPEDTEGSAIPTDVREKAATENKLTDEAPIPTYSEDLYKTPKAEVSNSAKPEAQAPAIVEPTQLDTASNSDAPKQEPAAGAPEAPSIEKTATQPDKPVAPPEEKAEATTPPSDPSEVAPSGDKAEAPLSTSDPKEVAANVTKDLSPDDAAALLKQIEDLQEMDPSAITPEMLSKLPHDIAQALQETGVLDSSKTLPEKGDAPYAAIRLPASVIDKFRGKDGIASIPENDTYAALGNRITLQLPGGGDIRKPEDLELFGFKP